MTYFSPYTYINIYNKGAISARIKAHLRQDIALLGSLRENMGYKFGNNTLSRYLCIGFHQVILTIKL